MKKYEIKMYENLSLVNINPRYFMDWIAKVEKLPSFPNF